MTLKQSKIFFCTRELVWGACVSEANGTSRGSFGSTWRLDNEFQRRHCSDIAAASTNVTEWVSSLTNSWSSCLKQKQKYSWRKCCALCLTVCYIPLGWTAPPAAARTEVQRSVLFLMKTLSIFQKICIFFKQLGMWKPEEHWQQLWC